MDAATTRGSRAVDDAAKAEYADLVRAAATGNRSAIERLLMRAQEVAYRFSLMVCGHPEDAEDVMQDALLNTYRHLKRIEEPESFRTWLFTTVRNACLMKRRRRAGEPAQYVPLELEAPSGAESRRPVEPVDASQPVDQTLMAARDAARLRAALGKLPKAYRMIVLLREMEGLSTREVAEVAGMSEANVKQRLHRARLMLRRQLEGEDA